MSGKSLIIIGLATLFYLSTFMSIVEADENDFIFNSFEFEYYNYAANTVYPALVVYCDYPEDIPHTYMPHAWDPYTYESYEEVLLDIPGEKGSLTGSFGDGKFIFCLTSALITPGKYNVTIVENSTNFLYTYSFDIGEGSYEANVTSTKWIVRKNSDTDTYNNPIDQGSIDKIHGIKCTLNIENVGDMPLSIGYREQTTLPISYQIHLYKNDADTPIYSSDSTEMLRKQSLFEGQDNNERCYFKPGELYEYEAIIDADFPNLEEYGSGTYSIGGQVTFEEMTYDFNCENILVIEGGSPGFEVLTAFVAIFFVSILLYKKRKRK